jgi:acyl-CoA dehydrogenase
MEQQGINLRPPEEIRQIIDALFKFIESEIIPLEKENKKLLESEVNMYESNGYETTRRNKANNRCSF